MENGKPLDSWKAIAGYLGTSIRTAQRWEEQNGLPVHRVLREKRAAVEAYPEELDAWLASRRVAPAEAQPGPAAAVGAPAVETPSRWKRGWAVGAAVLLLCGMAATLVGIGSRGPGGVTPQRLTGDSGHEFHPALSPDSKWVAYAWAEDGKSGLAVLPLAGGGSRRLVEGEALVYSPQWSPDGKWIAFLRSKDSQRADLVLYDWAGRSGTQVVKEVRGRVWFEALRSYPGLQWTRDGSGFLVVRRDMGRAQVVRMDLQSLEERVVLEVAGKDLGGLALSEDERRLAVVVQRQGVSQVQVAELGAGLRVTRALAPVVDGEVRSESPVWRQGELLFLRGSRQLWRWRGESSVPAVVRVDGEWPDYAVAASAAGDLVWTHMMQDSAVWLVETRTRKAVRKLCDSATPELFPRLAPDGKSYSFSSKRDGASALWVCQLATGVARRVGEARGGEAWDAAWSPDGQRLAYPVLRPGQGELRVVSSEGEAIGVIREPGAVLNNPSWTADGRRIFYSAAKGTEGKIRSANARGEDQRDEFQSGPVQEALVRRDGTLWLLYRQTLWLADPQTGERHEVARGVAILVGLAADGMGVVVNRLTSAALTGNYRMSVIAGDGKETEVIGPAPGVAAGYAPGPTGHVLAVREAGSGADLFRGVLP